MALRRLKRMYTRMADSARTHIVFTLYNDGYEEQEVKLPCEWAVCSRCRGKGTHTNPSVDGHGITMDEWNNEWSPEEQEEYLAGGYDVTCYECGGERVVPAVNEKSLTAEQRALYRRLIALEEELELCDAISESERRYGA